MAIGIVLLFLWMWSRACRGTAVNLARNGSRVLHAMMASSAGSMSHHYMDVDAISNALPWLPAYDRRDVLVIKAAMDNVASELHASHELHHNNDAVALSLYYSAIFRPSNGDAVGGRSLRAWLDDYKPFSASEYAEHQPFMHDLAPADWLDTPSALELSTTSEAAAAEVVTYTAASESPAALSDDTAGGGRTALAASNRASSSKSTHFTHELLSLGWRFSIGVNDSVQLPCGSMWVATRSRETVRSVHGLQPLASAKLVHVSIPLAVLMLVLATSVFAVTLCITLEHKSTTEAWMNDLPYKIAAVIFQTLYLLSASLLFTSRLGAEVTAIRGGRLPKPLMQSAKLEYTRCSWPSSAPRPTMCSSAARATSARCSLLPCRRHSRAHTRI